MKKTLITSILIALILTLLTNICFATNEMNSIENGMENVTTNAGEALQGAATGIGNGVRNGAEHVGNAVSDMGGVVMNITGMNNNDNMNEQANITNSNDYTATRTATTTTSTGTFLGMGPTAWTWIIMGIVGIAIIGLVWYYGQEHEYNSDNHND